MFFADHLLNIVLTKDSHPDSEKVTAVFAFLQSKTFCLFNRESVNMLNKKLQNNTKGI